MNKTITFVGDSINNLVYRAALCELHRWNLTVVGLQAGNMAPQASAPMQARLAAHWRHIARLSHVNKATDGAFWVGDPPVEVLVVIETNTLVVPKGWHRYKRSDAAGILSLSDVVVFNYGLHYHSPPGDPPDAKFDIYEKAMRGLFHQLAVFASAAGKGALFRETSAQHFRETGSYASEEQAHPKEMGPNGCICHPMAPEVLYNNDVSRLNDIVAKLAKEVGPPVGVLPFYNLTAPRFDMHEAGFCGFEQKRGNPESDGQCWYGCMRQCVCVCVCVCMQSAQTDAHASVCASDCTHLCHTPQLWRHVFAGLHEQLGRTNAVQPLPLCQLPG